MKICLPTIASLLAFLVTGPAFAADPLRDQAKGLFEPIPETPPALPGNRQRRESGARQNALFRTTNLESHDIAAARATILEWAAPTVARRQ